MQNEGSTNPEGNGECAPRRKNYIAIWRCVCESLYCWIGLYDKMNVVVRSSLWFQVLKVQTWFWDFEVCFCDLQLTGATICLYRACSACNMLGLISFGCLAAVELGFVKWISTGWAKMDFMAQGHEPQNFQESTQGPQIKKTIKRPRWTKIKNIKNVQTSIQPVGWFESCVFRDSSHPQTCFSNKTPFDKAGVSWVRSTCGGGLSGKLRRCGSVFRFLGGTIRSLSCLHYPLTIPLDPDRWVICSWQGPYRADDVMSPETAVSTGTSLVWIRGRLVKCWCALFHVFKHV